MVEILGVNDDFASKLEHIMQSAASAEPLISMSNETSSVIKTNSGVKRQQPHSGKTMKEWYDPEYDWEAVQTSEA